MTNLFMYITLLKFIVQIYYIFFGLCKFLMLIILKNQIILYFHYLERV